jgi:acetolactate synthase-1/2/3 large subunit
VAAARRPLLWIGSGASDAGPAVKRLLDLGFGMVTSWHGRGVVSEDHPQNIGSFTGYGMPPIQEFYRTCDLMLVAGSRLRAHETGDFSIPLPRPLLVVDIDPAADGRTYALDGFYRGHALTTLSALADRIDGVLAVDPSFRDDVGNVKAKMRAAYRETLGHYRDFPEIIRKALPADSIWARDITIANSTWGNRLFQLHSPRDNIYPVSAGIGVGFPLGLGASFAAPQRKTAILCGDGGFQLSIAEFWTAIQEKLNVILILMNDGGYGVIRQIQDVVAGGRRFYTDVIGPDVGELAANAAVWHRRVESVDELDDAITGAAKTSGPAIVEVIVPSIGFIPPYYPFNNTAKE